MRIHTQPDEVLRQEFLKPNNLTPAILSKEASCQCQEEDHFDISSDESGFYFRKARKTKQYNINEVIKSLSLEVAEMDWGKAGGKEVW